MDNKEIMPWMEKSDVVNIIKHVVKVWLSPFYTEKSRSKLGDNFTESHTMCQVRGQPLGSVVGILAAIT